VLTTIKDIFIKHPSKAYTPSAFNFAKNILLELKKKRLPPYPKELSEIKQIYFLADADF